jgi:signal transduction histidine kinase
MIKKITAIAIFSMLAFCWLYAAEIETPDAAKALVADAAKYLSENGRDATLKEIGNPEGKFVKGTLYVFAYDMDGKMLAHPIKPELLGKNLINEPDSKGKLFRKEIIELAKAKGEGWVDYTYANPKTGKEEAKTTYVLKVDDIVLCCGIYKSGK